MYGRNKGILSVIHVDARFRQHPARVFRPADTRGAFRRIWDWLVE